MSDSSQTETLNFFAETIEKVLSQGGVFFYTFDGVEEDQRPVCAEEKILIKQIWAPTIESIAVSVLKAATWLNNARVRVTREVLAERTLINARLGLEADDAEQILNFVLSVIFEEDLLDSPKILDINGAHFRFERNGEGILSVNELISRMNLLDVAKQMIDDAEKSLNPAARKELTEEARRLLTRCHQVIGRRSVAGREGVSPILNEDLRVAEQRVLALEYSLVF